MFQIPKGNFKGNNSYSCMRMEKEMATHFSILAGKISWPEEPGQATVHRVAKSWTWLSTQTCMHTHRHRVITVRLLRWPVLYTWWKKVKVGVTQWCLTLWDLKDCSPPGFSVHRLFQARILEWVAIPFSRGSFLTRDETQVSCTAGRFFTVWNTREDLYTCFIYFFFNFILFLNFT